MPPTHSSQDHASLRRRRLIVIITVAAVLAVVAVIGVRWWQQRAQEERQQALLAEMTQDVVAYEDSVFALLTPRSVSLGMVTGTADEGDEVIAEIEAECAAVAEMAVAVAEGAETVGAAPAAPEGLPQDVPGYSDLATRAQDAQDAAQAYTEAVAAASQEVATFCEGYPELARIGATQSAAVADLAEGLVACEESEEGCLPEETDSWADLRPDLEAAYVTGPAQRAELLTSWCPTASLESVCAARAQGETTLAEAGRGYLEAVDSGSREAVDAARGELAEQREAADTLLAEAAADLEVDLGEGEDAEAAVAAAVRDWTRAVQADWLAADEALMRTVG